MCSGWSGGCWRWRRSSGRAAHAQRRGAEPALEGAAEVGGVLVAELFGDALHRQAGFQQVPGGQFAAHVVEQFLEAGAFGFELADQGAAGHGEFLGGVVQGRVVAVAVEQHHADALAERAAALDLP